MAYWKSGHPEVAEHFAGSFAGELVRPVFLMCTIHEDRVSFGHVPNVLGGEC